MDASIIFDAKELRKTFANLTEYEAIRLVLEDKKIDLLQSIANHLKVVNTSSQEISEGIESAKDRLTSSLNNLAKTIEDKD